MPAKSELDAIIALSQKSESGNLSGTVAICAAQFAVENKDLDIIKTLPCEARQELSKIITHFLSEKTYEIYSNLGVTDHTPLLRELISLADGDPSNIFG